MSDIGINSSAVPIAYYQQPLFSYPNWFVGANWAWSSIIAAANKYPRMTLYVTINPNSGPDTQINSDFTQGISLLQACPNIVILGYIYTSYGARAQSGAGSVEADVDSWASFYPTINGIMLDEMANTAGNETYYSQITSYIKSKGGVKFNIVWGNPGTSTIQSYVGTVDTLLIWEGASLPAESDLIARTFYPSYPKNNFAIGSFSQNSLPSQSTINMFAKYLGYMHITDDNGSYATNPSYLDTEIADMLRRHNNSMTADLGAESPGDMTTV